MPKIKNKIYTKILYVKVTTSMNFWARKFSKEKGISLSKLVDDSLKARAQKEESKPKVGAKVLSIGG